MKKVVAIVIGLILVAGVSFAGAPREQSNKVTLSMYEYSDLTDETDVANTETLFDAFYASHPNIELEIEYGFNEPYHQKLQAMLVAKQLPDIVFLWPDKRTGYITGSGQIKDLRSYLAGHENEFAPAALTPQGPNGEIWELPEQVTATHVMYTNSKLMQSLGLSFPKTLAELIAQGDKIRAAGLIPIAMDNGDGWQMQSCFLSALTERAGGMEWYTRVISGDEASFADPEFVNALSVIDSLAKNEMFSPGINTAGYGEALTAFETEKAVYFIDGGWRVNNLVTELTDAQKQYMELHAFPDIPNQKGKSGSTAVVAGTGYGMLASLSGAKADAAWDWIWFYSGPEGSQLRLGFGANTAYKLQMDNSTDVMLRKLVTFINNAPAGYVIDSVMDGEGMGASLHPALQEMIFGNKTPQQVATEYEAWVAANDSARK